MKKDFGQRIDHVIVQQSLVDGSNTLQATAFKTLQEFGATRKGSSDYCPLWYKIERKSGLTVQSIQMQDVPAPAKTQPDDPTVVDLQELRKELRDDFKRVKAPPRSQAIRKEDSDDEIEAVVCIDD